MNRVIPLISQLSSSEQSLWLQRLSTALPTENFVLVDELDTSTRDSCDIAIVADPDVDILKSFANLKWVHSLWAGVENLVPIAKDQSFDIVRLVDLNLADAMAEAVLAWTLYLHRKIPSYAIQQQDKLWQPHPYQAPNECCVGILGLGELGKASAYRLVSNGFQVLGWSQSAKELAGVDTYHGEQGLNDMLQKSQVIVCLLPLTENTRGLINEKFLSHLPKGASLINFARGALIVTDDLVSSLNNNHCYHAVLDVFEQEPLPIESELWGNRSISILPHIAAATNPQTAAKIVAKNITEYRNNGHLDSFVDLNRGY